MKAPQAEAERGRPVRQKLADERFAFLCDYAPKGLAYCKSSWLTGRSLPLWAALLLLCTLAFPVLAQGPPLVRETFSREFSIYVGGEQTPLVKEIVSREVSVFIGAEPQLPFAQAISREMSIVVTTLAIPDRVT